MRNIFKKKRDLPAEFLFGCKNLYWMSIHPFDFDKKDTPEYKGIIDAGKSLLESRGVQSFIGFIYEYQYRVDIWAAIIILKYGLPELNDIIEINQEQRIGEACIETINKDEIEPLTDLILENKKNFIYSVKTRNNIG